MSESADFWEGYETALNLMSIELDKVLAACYNERRTQNDLLDVKVSIKTLKEMMPHGEETLAVDL